MSTAMIDSYLEQLSQNADPSECFVSLLPPTFPDGLIRQLVIRGLTKGLTLCYHCVEVYLSSNKRRRHHIH